MTRDPASSPASPVRIALLLATGLGLFAAVLFAPAGRLDWAAGWLYLGLVVANLTFNYAYLRRRNPELIEYRTRIGKGIKTWDKVWAWLYTPVFCRFTSWQDSTQFATAGPPCPAGYGCWGLQASVHGHLLG